MNELDPTIYDYIDVARSLWRVIGIIHKAQQ